MFSTSRDIYFLFCLFYSVFHQPSSPTTRDLHILVKITQSTTNLVQQLCEITGDFIANTKKSATEKGFVVTIAKRRREIERSEVDRQAVNSIIQGSAADIMKKAIIEISSKLHAMVQRDHLTEPGTVPTIICQVHDELLIETPCSKDLYIEVLKIVKEAMENTAREFFGVSVPIPVNFKVGTKYGSLRSIPSPALLGT